MLVSTFLFFLGVLGLGCTLLLLHLSGSTKLDAFDTPIMIFLGATCLFTGSIGISGVLNFLSTRTLFLLSFLIGGVLGVLTTFIYKNFIFNVKEPQSPFNKLIGSFAQVTIPVSSKKVGQICLFDEDRSRIYFVAKLVEEELNVSKDEIVCIVNFENHIAMIKSKNTPVTSTTRLETRLSLKNQIISCYECGTDLNLKETECPKCGTAQVVCIICRGHIQSDNRLFYCPFCGAVAHEPHFLEWLKVQGICPICREKISI